MQFNLNSHSWLEKKTNSEFRTASVIGVHWLDSRSASLQCYVFQTDCQSVAAMLYNTIGDSALASFATTFIGRGKINAHSVSKSLDINSLIELVYKSLQPNAYGQITAALISNTTVQVILFKYQKVNKYIR